MMVFRAGGMGSSLVLGVERVLLESERALVALRLVVLQVASLVVLLQVRVVLEVFGANCTFKNLRLAERRFQHLLVHVQSLLLQF